MEDLEVIDLAITVENLGICLENVPKKEKRKVMEEIALAIIAIKLVTFPEIALKRENLDQVEEQILLATTAIKLGICLETAQRQKNQEQMAEILLVIIAKELAIYQEIAQKKKNREVTSKLIKKLAWETFESKIIELHSKEFFVKKNNYQSIA